MALRLFSKRKNIEKPVRAIKKANISIDEIPLPSLEEQNIIPQPEKIIEVPPLVKEKEEPKIIEQLPEKKKTPEIKITTGEEHFLKEFVAGNKLISDANNKLLQKLKDLEKENEELKKKLKEQERMILKISDEVKPLKQIVQDSQIMNERLKQQVENDKELIRKQNLQISDMIKKNSELEKIKKKQKEMDPAIIDGLKKEAESENLLLKELNNNVELLRERNTRKDNVITSLKDTINKIELKNADKDKMMLSLKNNIGGLRLKITQLKNASTEQGSNSDFLKKNIETLSNKINELKQEINEKDSYYPILTAIERSNIESDNEEFLRSVESELILLRTENKKLRNQVDVLNKAVSERQYKEKTLLQSLKTLIVEDDLAPKKTPNLVNDPKLKEILDILAVSLASGDTQVQAKASLIKLGYDEKLVSKAIKIRKQNL